MNLTGNVALVTGAGSGIGRAVALRLAAAGAKVVIADFNEEAGARICAELKQSGAEAVSQRTDVSKTDEVQATYRLYDSDLREARLRGQQRGNPGRFGLHGRVH